MIGAVTAFALLGIDWGLFGKIAGLAVGLLVGSVWAFTYCTMLVIIDLLLLGVKVRTLPAGLRGWGASLVSPLAVFGVYGVLRPHTFWPYGWWTVAAVVLVPMLVVAIVTRVFAGRKPLR